MDCPICGQKFPATFLNDHVNACIDGAVTFAPHPREDTAKVSTKTTSKSQKSQSIISSFFQSSSPGASFVHATTSTATQQTTTLKSLELTGSSFPDRGLQQKRILGTNFVMDAFRDGPIDGVQFYFLSHFHSDHYQGLTKSFNWGRLVCTPVTANLVIANIGVPEDLITKIPLDSWIDIDGISILAVDAFHCPGSAIFFFGIPPEDPNDPNGRYEWILHTGDFRASKELVNNPILTENFSTVFFKAIYLDTTYCNPQYTFPSQSAVIQECCRMVERQVNKSDLAGFAPIRRLILVGTYLIGKEKVALAVAKMLGSKIYCNARKRMIIKAMQWPEVESLLTDNPLEAQVHLCSLGDLDEESLGKTLDQYWPKFTHITALKPTGWAYKPGSKTPAGTTSLLDHLRKDNNGQFAKRKDAISVYSFAYSEHSSFPELVNFLSAHWLHYEMVIPTVDNPSDLYLNRKDYRTPEQLLLSWSASSKRRQ